MNTTAEQVMNDAMGLPASLRAFVAEKLIESLDTSEPAALSSSWRAEIRRRCEEMDQGAVSLIEADAVFAKAHAALA